MSMFARAKSGSHLPQPPSRFLHPHSSVPVLKLGFLSLLLTYIGTLVLRNGVQGPYGNDVQTLHLQVFLQDRSRLRVKITDPNRQRWEVPDVVHLPDPLSVPSVGDMADYRIAFTQSPFGFTVTRASTGEVIFDTSPPSDNSWNNLVFEDQYLEFSTAIGQNPNIYGLGERIHALRLDPSGKDYVMFNIDVGTPSDTNLYGTHPFYLEYRPTGSHGVFLLNSNAQDVFIQPGSLTWKTVGGVIDLFIVTGPTPEEAIQQYHQIIGTPAAIPYWSLGWHQCRWGYHNISVVKSIVESYAKYNLPLDTMWNDIDYMNGYEVFTFDPTRYPLDEVQPFVKQLHDNGQHYVVIVDPGIKALDGYFAYDQGIQQDVFIKAADGVTPIQNIVWPGFTTFTDFSLDRGRKYWTSLITDFIQNVAPVDGLWIDMNEISGFCEGSCYNTSSSSSSSQADAGDFSGGSSPFYGPSFDPENPPYVPGQNDLDYRTLNMSARLNYSLNYDVHNMYGFLETVATREALLAARNNKRPFILSRSTFAGQGHHGAHWLGDNDATWDSLAQSIPGILSFQMYGIPLVGADICGFNGKTTSELCTRWTQLGSFYPFSRNHDSIDSISHEPWVFGEPLLSVTRNALNQRYALLPHFYTLFADANKIGGTVWRPLFFEFPQDQSGQIAYIDKQFMIGSSLLVSPVLTQGATSVSAYFPPAAIWYDMYTGLLLPAVSGGWVTLDAPLNGLAPAHIRGGSIVPTQEPALTTTAARKNPFGLLVALDANGIAAGKLQVDDGETLPEDPHFDFAYISYAAQDDGKNGGLLTSTFINAPQSVTQDSVMGSIRISGISQACVVTVNGQKTTSFSVDTANKILTISNQSAKMSVELNITWSC